MASTRKRLTPRMSHVLEIAHLTANRLYVSGSDERSIIDNFHKLYYESSKFGKTFAKTHFLGVQVLKTPLDLWLYQEIIYDTKPDIIIETGTYWGGSAYFMASMCDLVGRGQIVTIDIEKKEYPEHKRITYINASSTSDEAIGRVKEIIAKKPGAKVMVILDSDHSKAHVLKEMELYGPMVSQGCYMVVEDTNIHGHPIRERVDIEGPMEAITEYMKTHKDFETDKSMHKFLLTFNPDGYLRKK